MYTDLKSFSLLMKLCLRHASVRVETLVADDNSPLVGDLGTKLAASSAFSG